MTQAAAIRMHTPAQSIFNDSLGPLTDQRYETENADQLPSQLVSLYLISSAISSVLRRTRTIVKGRARTSIQITEAFLGISFRKKVGIGILICRDARNQAGVVRGSLMLRQTYESSVIHIV
jgi:hypothetical protein